VTEKTSGTRLGIGQEILSYLAEHPRSEDSVEGIVEWWLLHHYVAKTRNAVRAALTQLVERRLVLERAGTDGKITFRLNPRKRALAIRLAHGTHLFL
jgi:Fe2+ or Zn2+ uptake regulation protein